MVCMKVSDPAPGVISESMQMYLVTIARLRESDEPVPLSRLAETLSVAPASVNEMCRKLQDQELLIYQPYRGAVLTAAGDQLAQYILRRHRLWEVFLVEKLGFDQKTAHDLACRLEHATPETLGERLDAFLGHPVVNPEGLPIPRGDRPSPLPHLADLASLAAGQVGHVVNLVVGDAARAFLEEQGLRAGAALVVLGRGRDSLLIAVGNRELSLAVAMARGVQVHVPV
jgi:DtxR family transcriptional regulator, Mn-dependent transcriptional regulator